MIIKNRNTIVRIFMAFFACLIFLPVKAQVKVETSVDKKQVLIGEQFKLDITAAFMPDQYIINWLKVPDTFGHFEVIERSEIDSIYAEDKLVGYEQSFTLTSFDSGTWAIPSFTIEFLAKADSVSEISLTDSIPITVSYSLSDTTQQLKDIKPIRDADDDNILLYWIINGLLLVFGIAALLLYLKFRRKIRSKFTQVSTRSAYDTAKQQLDKLKQMPLSTADEIKIYHTTLTDVFKKYASSVFKVNYVNKTTGEILVLLKQEEVDAMSIAALAAVLRSTDAVKFAKYLPESTESRNMLHEVEKIIEHLANTNHKIHNNHINPHS